MVDKKRLVVTKDENSPTGYWIKSGNGQGMMATLYEVRLWNMYLEALDLAKRLREELDRIDEVKSKAKT